MSLVPVNEALAQREPVAAVMAWCEQARGALIEARTLTEAQNVLGAVSTLEHAVKVRDLNADAVVAASAMRVRAERRCGELIAEERDAGRLASRDHKPGRPLKVVGLADDFQKMNTLANHGISRDQAAEFSRLAEPDDVEFDAAVETVAEQAREQKGTGVTRSAVLRKLDPEREKRPDERWLEADRFIDACKRVSALGDAALSAIRFGTYPGDEPLISDAAATALRDAAAVIQTVQTALSRRKTDA